MKKTKPKNTPDIWQKLNEKTIAISIKSNGNGRLSGTSVSLSNGLSLGLVQSIDWRFAIGDTAPSCVIKTIFTPAELKVLTKNTKVKFSLLKRS